MSNLDDSNTFIADVINRRGRTTTSHNGTRHVELYGARIIEPTPFEPDPTTYRGTYYYNSTTNRLYRKVITRNDPTTGIITAHWKGVSE